MRDILVRGCRHSSLHSWPRRPTNQTVVPLTAKRLAPATLRPQLPMTTSHYSPLQMPSRIDGGMAWLVGPDIVPDAAEGALKFGEVVLDTREIGFGFAALL